MTEIKPAASVLHKSNAFRSVLEIIVIMVNEASITAWNAARAAGLPQRYAEQYLQPLVHAGILRSQRGPRGGTWLDCDLDTTTLGDIFRIMNDQTSRRPQTKEWTKTREAIDILFDETIERRMIAVLDEITVSQFVASVGELQQNRVQSAACQTQEVQL